MYLVLKLTLAAVVAGDVLLLCMAVLLFLILKRSRTRAREPETPSENDRQRGKTAQEDAEAWQRLQAYTVDDAYGGSSG